jgi:thiamine kinase-like enzyme
MNDPTLADPVERIRALSLWRAAVSPERLEGGLSNQNFLVRDGTEPYVVRFVGGDDPAHGIVRDREVAVSRAAHRAGIAPELVLAEPGLLVLRFVAGRALGEDDLRDPAMLARVAELLRSCHRDVAAHLRGPAPCFWVFHALRDYLAQLDAQGGEAGRTERLRRVIARLERAVGPSRLALTHNDLMPGNIIDDGQRLWLIDWEFAGYGAPLFDLASLAVDNGVDEAGQAQLLAFYFGRPAGAALLRRFAAMVIAAELREALWARIQEIHGKVPFDYAGYGEKHEARFERAYAAFSPDR